MFRKFIYILFKVGAWWFFILGLLMASIMFVELVNPRPDSDPDVLLRLAGFILPALMGFMGFLMIKAKKVYPWEPDK